MNKNARVSIVIPVYNEADQIRACLQAIAVQTIAPYEVIVVDNNSTDETIQIARRFPFVRIIMEAKQGVVHARNRGFDAAKGEIIGRIDADSLIAPDWVETLQQLFADKQLDAVSGSVSYHDLPWHSQLARLDLVFRQWIANGMAGDVFLFGSNMGLRWSAWQRVRTQVCNTGGIHEDFDVAIHLVDIGHCLRFDKHLQAAVSLRRFDTSFASYREYVWLSPNTYRWHGRNSHRRMYPVVCLVVSLYGLIQLLYRCYDAETDSLSWRNLKLHRSSLRVNPATFVDKPISLL